MLTINISCRALEVYDDEKEPSKTGSQVAAGAKSHIWPQGAEAFA